ncbi:MAG: cyclase [Deltaproteobacteria bacterium HGW-Deltaproteobacteria-10]|nr:MAG: cyclase [Deltaproteobacteria bacterium HGW-Deltaproteobacteria-10]
MVTITVSNNKSMKRYVRLSYAITEETPLYPGTQPTVIEQVRVIKKGDSCNTLFISLSNHAGTHVDAPRHFWDSGKSIDGYSANELIFRKPRIFDCPKGINEVIDLDDVRKLPDKQDTDLIIIKTGFSSFRENDQAAYCSQNPCLTPDAARWLKNNFPLLRAVGIDCISIASTARRDMGRETHRILLGEESGKPLLILEDIFIPAESENLQEVIVAPLFIGDGDGAPCTVIGVFGD